MKIIYLAGFILLVVFAYSVYDLYHLSCVFGADCNTTSDYNDKREIEKTVEPETQPQPPKQGQANLNNADLYVESQYVPNKGFLNELIFKPPTYSDELEQTSGNSITSDVPVMPLNTSCQISRDLPIANINVKYMLGKNTTMLRDDA